MYFTPWPVVVFTAFLSCTVADRVDLVGEIQQFERGSPCNNDRSDCVLLSVLVKRIVAPENEGAIYLSHVTPGDVIPVSASVEELGDIASSSNNPAKLHRSVYFELEKKETSAAWWQVVEKRPPLILPDSRHQSLSEQSPLRSRRQTGTADRIVHEAQCCYHGLGHFLVEKGTKDWCLKLTYPPQYSYLTCNSDADLCCQCCQLGYNIRASYSSNFCGLGPRLGYKGSCLVLFRLCCYDRPERHFELQNLDPANGLINGTFTVYGNPKRTEWELETDPGIPKTDELSLMISIIESWAEAVEIRFEPNGDRMSSGLFNATLDVTFPDGQKLHIDYTRVPGEGETQGYSVVTNVTGSIAESFDKLSHLTSFFLTPDFTDNSLTLVKGIASADTLPEGWSMSLGAAFKPARFAPSKSSQLDINLAIVRRKGHVVDVTTTSTIRTIGYEDIPLDILHTLKPQVTLWNTSVVHNSDNQSLGLIVDSEEDTVEVSLPSSEEDGSIAASIPPILGVLLLDQEGDRELFEGAVPSTAQGVVFGGEEEERTGSLVNSTLSGLSPSLSLSSVVTSSGEVPLRLDQVSKVSSLPVDTDGDGAPDAVAVVVFGGGPGEEPLGVYVVRTAAADPTGIPEEGSQASVSVSSKQVKGQPVLTLDLEETKPLDFSTLTSTCKALQLYYIQSGTPCPSLPTQCSSASFEPICNQHTRVSGVVNIVRENRTIATQPFSAIVTGSSSLNISSSSSSSLAPVSTLSVFTSSLPLLFLFNISLSHLSGTNITGLVGVDSPHPIPVQSVFLSEEKEGSLNFTLSSTVYFPSNMVEVSTLQQPMKAGLVHSFDKKRLYIAIFEDHSSSLLPSSVPAVFEIQYSNITDSTRLSIPLSGIQVAFNASSDGQGGLFSHFTQPTSTYDPVRLCSAVVQYLTRTNGKCIDVPQICPLHTFSALCTLPVTVAVGNILVEVENIPEPLKNVLNVSFEEDGLVLYTWTAATRNSLLENLSPLITPVFSWLSGSKDCISNDCLNGLQASEGNIHARIEAAFVTGEVVDIYFHFWPLAINRSSIGYGFEINITGRLPTSLYVPNHLLQYLIRLQEFAPGLVSGSEMVRICDSQTVQLSVTVNYTPSVTYNRPVFDNVRLNASFAHLTWQKDISALTFSSRASLIYPLSVTLSGIVTENLIESEPFLFHGTVPWIGNATANIFLPPLMSIGADDAPVHIASIPAVMSIHNICILTDPYGLCNFTGGIVTENRNASVLFDGKVLLNDSHLAILVNYNISGAHIGILGAVPNLRIVKLPGRMQNELFIVVLSASNSTESALPKFVFQISVTSSANVSEEGELSYAHTETLLSKRIVRLTAPTAAVIHQDKVSITLACEAIHNYLKVLSLKPCQFSPVACEVLCGSGMPSVPLFPVRIYLRGVINGTHYIPRTEIELRSGKITHNRIRAIFKLNLGATLCLDGYIKLLPLITPHLVWLSDIGVINVSGLYLPDHNFNGSASISFGALGGEITLEHSLVRRVRRDGSEMINYFITAQGTLPFGYRGIEPQKKFTFRLSEREPGKASSDMPVSLFPGSTADLVLKFAYTTSKANNCSSYNNSVVSVRHSDVIIRGFLDRLSVFITGGLQGFEAGKGCPLECACPGAPGTNSSFSSECVQTADSSVGECRGCPKGFEGKNCESCALGYYGNPVSGIACRKCRCNGNVDRSDPNWCDRQTGVCQCTGLTSGHHCDSCVAGAVVDGRGICRQPDGVRLAEQSNIVYQTEEGRLNLLRAKLEFRFDSSQANGSLLLLAQDDTASGDVLYAALYNARVVLHARISQQHYSLVTSQNYKPLVWHSFEVAYGQTGLSMGIGNESVSIGEEENWPDFNLGTELVIGQPLSSEIPSLPDFVQSEGLHGCIQSVSLIVGRQGTEETAAASAQPIRTREVSSCFTHHES